MKKNKSINPYIDVRITILFTYNKYNCASRIIIK